MPAPFASHTFGRAARICVIRRVVKLLACPVEFLAAVLVASAVGGSRVFSAQQEKSFPAERRTHVCVALVRQQARRSSCTSPRRRRCCWSCWLVDQHTHGKVQGKPGVFVYMCLRKMGSHAHAWVRECKQEWRPHANGYTLPAHRVVAVTVAVVADVLHLRSVARLVVPPQTA